MQTLTVPPNLQPGPRTAHITVEQYHRMIQKGALKEGAPFELRRGLLVLKNRSASGADPMTIGEKHAVVVNLLSRLGATLLAQGCFMQTQNPIVIPPDNEPEPDGAILRGDVRDYSGRKPGVADVLALIEVADSSLEDDRTDKLAEYAGAGVPQYFIINIPERQIEFFSAPQPDLRNYSSTRVFKPGESIQLPVGNGGHLDLAVADLLP